MPLFEVGEYRIKEETSEGVTMFYPQRLVKGFAVMNHWVTFEDSCGKDCAFDTMMAAQAHIKEHAVNPKKNDKVTTTYHKVEI